MRNKLEEFREILSRAPFVKRDSEYKYLSKKIGEENKKRFEKQYQFEINYLAKEDVLIA